MRKAQQNSGDRGRLDPTIIYEGVVRDIDVSTGTYSVDVGGEVLIGCIDMVGPAGSFLGVQVHNRIPAGTQVLIKPGATSWIINTKGIEYPVPDQCHSRLMTGTGVKDVFQDTVGMKEGMPKSHVPNDLGEGEFEWKHATGPLFRFLLGLVQLGTNERSKIEMNLHRELVRIVSRNFEFFAATGDESDYDDGRLNRVHHGTPYEHERFGVKEGEPILEDTDKPPDFDEYLKKTGRWRWSQYLGFLGDLVNHWFTDPQEAAGELVSGQYRSGKCRQHIGHDGTFLVQSTGDIVLERVVRIPVPIRIKHEEDPEGVTREMMEELDDKFLKQWSWDVEDAHKTAFMLRDYARYLNQFQSLARFLQFEDKDEYEVPSEEQTPEPNEIDPDREAVVWHETYSTIRIMRDGSIVTMDGYGNATCSGPYGIIYSSSTDLQLLASRDIILKAGRSLFMSGRRHVELVAHFGGLILKSRTSFKMLVEEGVMWIKSNFDPKNPDPYEPEEGSGDPEAEVHGDLGIIIQNKKSRTLVDSGAIRVETHLTSLDEDDDEELGIEVKTEHLKLSSAHTVLHFTKKLDLIGAKIRLKVSRVIGSMIGLIWLRKQLKFQGGAAEFSSVQVRRLTADQPLIAGSTVVGKKDPREDDEIMKDVEDELPELPEIPDPFENLKPVEDWAMFEQEEYDPFDELMEPLTQQRLRLGEKLGPEVGESFLEEDRLETWSNMTEDIRQGDETDSRPPWPGKSRKWLTYAPTYPELGEPTGQKPKTFEPPDNPKLNPQSIQFKYIKEE